MEAEGFTRSQARGHGRDAGQFGVRETRGILEGTSSAIFTPLQYTSGTRKGKIKEVAVTFYGTDMKPSTRRISWDQLQAMKRTMDTMGIPHLDESPIPARRSR